MKILGYTYKVNCEVDNRNMNGIGRLRSDSLQIDISGDVAEGQKMSTLLHEIIEALNYHLALGIQHQKIMALESGLYQVLIDNGVDLSPLMVEET
jgi:hypothetical protein